MPRKKPKTKAGKKRKMHKVMGEYRRGTLRSSSGRKVTSRKQAIAIGLNVSGQSNKAKPKKRRTKRRKKR
jgi:hypothetical protein